MAVYAIYHIHLIKSAEQNLPVYDSEPATSDSYRREFERILSQAVIPVYKPQKDDTSVPLDCVVKAKHHNVTMLLLNNEKTHKYLEGKDTEELTYHPGCYVFIDNRPGDTIMAIERTNAFESQPDKVRDLLQAAFKNILKEKEIEVDIRARMHEAKFWDAIDEQCRVLNDSVRRISFNFPNPNRVVNLSEQQTQKLQMLSALTQAVNATKGTLHLEAEKNRSLLLDQTQEDLANMVTLCCTTGYSIAVRFKKYGLYRFGNNIRSYAQFSDEEVAEFCTGQMIMGKAEECEYALLNSLENIRQSDNLYIDEEPTPQRRKGSH